MANTDAAQVVNKVRHSSYSEDFLAAFGEHLFDDTPRAFRAILMSLEVYQQLPAAFYPYTSKYDAVLRGKASLSEQEQRGLAAFNDASKGNCASCHPSAIVRGAFPQFTDYGFTALGVPRNKTIPANADAHYHDLGLCGPLRTDLAQHNEYCGRFRTPSLRNVATRKVFFHNGAVYSLRDAVRFYAERDVTPSKWYPRDAHGKVMKFDDLPGAYIGNVEMGAPFGGHEGDKPMLSSADIDDIVVFLETLTDGYASAKQ
jgi:cytochrome c peroxidase